MRKDETILDTKLNILKQSLKFEQEDDIKKVEDILNVFYKTASDQYTEELTKLVSDEIEEPAILGDLIETILNIVEKNKEKSMQKVLAITLGNSAQIDNSIQRMYKIILDSDPLFKILENSLIDLSTVQKENLIKILENRSKKQPEQYKIKISILLNKIS